MTALVVVTRDGSHVREVEADVLAMRERVRFGDATIGWRGDLTARLMRRVDTDTGEQTFFVMMTDALGDDYVAAALSPGERLSPRILVLLAEGDWQGGRGVDLVRRQQDAQIRAEEARAARHREHVHEHVIPKLYDIIRRG